MTDGTYLLLEEVFKDTDTRRTGLSMQNGYARMLAEPFSKGALHFLVE